MTARLLFAMAVIVVLWWPGSTRGEEDAEKTGDPPASKPLASLDIANTEDGSHPGGATPRKGVWKVDQEAEELRLAPEPLSRGWLEFGPEIREKGATIVVTARGPGKGRLQSRFGAGLHGENGFQIEAVPVNDEVELVRRGAVLTREPFELDADATYDIELSVVEDGGNWLVSGRIRETEAERPEEPLFEYKAFADELLFPLAGRAALVATPFSGEPVAYAAASVYEGAYVPPAPKEEEAEESDDDEDGEGDE
ncbi:MAG: hypothetical protein WD342_07935 [Verrucomicrobiales bacterium]